MALFGFAARHTAKVLALLTVVLGAGAQAGERTVWLVRPLYPGQEALVEKIEQSLMKIIPAQQRADEIIGHKELAKLLGGAKLDTIACLSGEERCLDPIDPFVARLGIDRVVMVQGGQDESGFNFKVTSYKPAKGETQAASASNVVLDRAFLGAIVKVVPLASTLEVVTTPPGAVVYVDDQKVGTTPLSTQVLPGDRVLRVDLKLHQPIEETVRIQARGSGKIERNLEKVAARLSVTAQPPGTVISIDGQVAGKDRIDRGIAPGRHTIRLTADGHRATEETIEVKPDQQYNMEKSLEPIPGAVTDKPTNLVVIDKQPDVVIGGGQAPPPPPAKEEEKPLTWTEQVYKRGNYFYLGFDVTNLLERPYETTAGTRHRTGLVSRRWGNEGIGRTAYFSEGSTTFVGVSGEFGIMSRYFGITVIGASAHFQTTPIELRTGTDGALIDPGAQDPSNPFPCEYRPTEVKSPCGATAVRLPEYIRVKIQLYTLRAIHPQLRIAAWRFLFTLSAGLEFRAGYVLEDGPTPDVKYKDGFAVLDLLLGSRLGARFYLVDGFFIHGTFNFQVHLLGETAVVSEYDSGVGDKYTGPSAYGFNVGVGYGF